MANVNIKTTPNPKKRKYLKEKDIIEVSNYYNSCKKALSSKIKSLYSELLKKGSFLKVKRINFEAEIFDDITDCINFKNNHPNSSPPLTIHSLDVIYIKEANLNHWYYLYRINCMVDQFHAECCIDIYTHEQDDFRVNEYSFFNVENIEYFFLDPEKSELFCRLRSNLRDELTDSIKMFSPS